MDYSALDTIISRKLSTSIDELCRLTAQPSVSAEKQGVNECAELVMSLLRARGFHVERSTHANAPVLFAERKGTADRTLIFYNHYDVQPADPLELWSSPPFTPEIRGGRLYGRGVNDNKGNITNRLLAIDALLEQVGELPCTIKFVLEGEEETTSANFTEYVKQNAEKLRADLCVWEFGGVDEDDRPVQYLGLRGICYVEMRVTRANQDIHSGLGGSIFPNAAWRLVWALQSLKNEREEILVDGFYADVLPLSAKTIEYVNQLPDLTAIYKERYAITGFLKGMTGGLDFKLAEAHVPTCTICGLNSGYQGPGSKTIIPAAASAKVDFRLVPDQDPHTIFRLLREHLDRRGFPDIEIELLADSRPAVTDADHPLVRLVANSAIDVYGVPMQIVPSVGGSGPNAIFKDMVNIPILSAGVSHPDAQPHAPDENVRIDLYEKAARHLVRIIGEFAAS